MAASKAVQVAVAASPGTITCRAIFGFLVSAGSGASAVMTMSTGGTQFASVNIAANTTAGYTFGADEGFPLTDISWTLTGAGSAMMVEVG